VSTTHPAKLTNDADAKPAGSKGSLLNIMSL